MNFAERLERAIKARGFRSLNGFAEEHRESEGLRPSTLAEYRNGSTPRPEMMAKLCRLLQIDEMVWRYGSDEEFETMLAGEAGARAVGSRTFTLTSAIEEDWTATGPNAWKHFNLARHGYAADALDSGRGLRSGKPHPARVVDLAGVPFGADLFEVQSTRRLPIMVDGGEVDSLVPGEILIVSHDTKPSEGDLVIAKRESDEQDELIALDIRLARFHRLGKHEWILPLDEDQQHVAQLGRGWEVVGVVVERRRVR
jgi:hypothetical protein